MINLTPQILLSTDDTCFRSWNGGDKRVGWSMGKKFHLV